MKLVFKKIKDSPLNVLRRAGYAFQKKDERTGEMSFVKRVGNADYPRFHIYVRALSKGDVEVKLHIDQKKASYGNQTAHSGEYDSAENKWLEHEAENIKKEFNLSF